MNLLVIHTSEEIVTLSYIITSYHGHECRAGGLSVNTYSRENIFCDIQVRKK